MVGDETGVPWELRAKNNFLDAAFTASPDFHFLQPPRLEDFFFHITCLASWPGFGFLK